MKKEEKEKRIKELIEIIDKASSELNKLYSQPDPPGSGG